MIISEAQKDMRAAFVAGAPGVLASGIVWSVAGIAALSFPFRTSFILFFFGGMLIQPLAVLGSKMLSRTGAAQRSNPFNTLALESTILLFAGLFVAWFVARTNDGWFYPIMLITIGARYFIFATIYGERIFWALGGCLVTLGVAAMMSATFSTATVAISGGIIEIVFAIVLFAKDRR